MSATADDDWGDLGVLTDYRTLVYFEGDATMRTFNDKDGQTQSALSLVQTKIEVLKRPQPKTVESVEM